MEPQNENDLFFVCSLIEYIARYTKNEKSYIVNKLGIENIKKIYDLADVYHSDNMEKVALEFIDKCNIDTGNYDIITSCKESIPSVFDIGKVYRRLILRINSNESDYIKTIMEVMNSFIMKHFDNYNSSFYYETPEYHYECYKNGKIL